MKPGIQNKSGLIPILNKAILKIRILRIIWNKSPPRSYSFTLLIAKQFYSPVSLICILIRHRKNGRTQYFSLCKVKLSTSNRHTGKGGGQHTTKIETSWRIYLHKLCSKLTSNSIPFKGTSACTVVHVQYVTRKCFRCWDATTKRKRGKNMTDTDVERIQPKHNERFLSFSQEFKKQTAV